MSDADSSFRRLFYSVSGCSRGLGEERLGHAELRISEGLGESEVDLGVWVDDVTGVMRRGVGQEHIVIGSRMEGMDFLAGRGEMTGCGL